MAYGKLEKMLILGPGKDDGEKLKKLIGRGK